MLWGEFVFVPHDCLNANDVYYNLIWIVRFIINLLSLCENICVRFQVIDIQWWCNTTKFWMKKNCSGSILVFLSMNFIDVEPIKKIKGISIFQFLGTYKLKKGIWITKSLYKIWWLPYKRISNELEWIKRHCSFQWPNETSFHIIKSISDSQANIIL